MAKAGNREELRNISVKMPFGEKDYYVLEKQLLHVQKYMATYTGYDPKAPDPKEAATKDSLFLAKQLRWGNSVIFEPSIEKKGQFHEELEAVVAAAEALFAGFDDLITRCARHTDLCVALRALRTAAEAKPKSPFFRVIVDIHDCVWFTGPEDMTEKMAKVIGNVVPNLSNSMTKEELFSITDKLFDAGLRPWSPPCREQEEIGSGGE